MCHFLFPQDVLLKVTSVIILRVFFIKHIFFGHQHITVSGNYLGIPFSSPRSINHPLVPNFSNEYRLGSANTEPSYNIALINNDSLIIHNEDFLKVETNWFETTKSGWIEESDN